MVVECAPVARLALNYRWIHFQRWPYNCDFWLSNIFDRPAAPSTIWQLMNRWRFHLWNSLDNHLPYNAKMFVRELNKRWESNGEIFGFDCDKDLAHDAPHNEIARLCTMCRHAVYGILTIGDDVQLQKHEQDDANDQHCTQIKWISFTSECTCVWQWDRNSTSCHAFTSSENGGKKESKWEWTCVDVDWRGVTLHSASCHSPRILCSFDAIQTNLCCW